MKTCRSCGKYYDGEYCPHCGYGKEATASKELEKYKKYHKPERFMTDEEKAEYYKELKAANKEKSEKAKAIDPNGRRNLLIAVAVLAVVLIFAVLIKNGVIFKQEKTDVINDYCRALSEQDYDALIKCFPKEVKDSYEDERRSLKMDKDEAMDSFLSDLTALYGDGFTAEVSIGREEKVDIKELALDGYEQEYGRKPDVDEVYIVVCEVTYSGSLKSETVQYDFYLGKTANRWKIFNIQLRLGIIDPSMDIELAQE